MTEIATSRRAAAGQRLELLDCLRLLAAVAVVCTHWLHSGIEEGKLTSVSHFPWHEAASYGYLGVYLFFLISGFVIATSLSGKTPAQFAVGRLLRLYPAYWVALCLTSLVILVFSPPSQSVNPVKFAANLTMVSRILGQPYVDGVYWTLFLELMFYLAVFALLLLGLRRHFDVIMLLWTLQIAVVELAVPGLRSMILFGSIYSFFAAGAIISAADRRGWTLVRAVAVGVNLVVSLRFILRNASEVGHVGAPAVIALIIVACYGVMVLQTVPSVRQWRIPGSRFWGNLTYPVYLLHAGIGYALLNRFADDSNKWYVYPLLFLLLLAGAWLLHTIVEVRMRPLWKRLFGTTAGKAADAISAGAERISPSLGGRRELSAGSTG